MPDPATDHPLVEPLAKLKDAEKKMLVELLNEQFAIEGGKPVNRDRLVDRLRRMMDDQNS